MVYDIDKIYAFWCARYENISFEKFLSTGITEFKMKMWSIPESEPLYKVIKSRVINVATIKDKEERKYWRELKRINKIPNIYLSSREIEDELKKFVKKNEIKKFGG